jgi:hypothetical protein
MIEKIFSVSGNKISSLIIDESSLKFSSQSHNSFAQFQESWGKKLSLATKVEVKFDSIRSIKKEENEDEILIKYKTFAGIPSECEFSFDNKTDYDTFFYYFEKEKNYQKSNEPLTSFKAIKNYLIGLAVTIGGTIFSYNLAAAISDGTADVNPGRKGRFFYSILNLIGDKGVLLIGTAISAFLIYKIWTRFKNPPNQIVLLPANS